ncbi:MAG: IS21 family transposase [Candidatus Dormibacteraeota bacterium]|uniref:IS21 family transposase n=1 Tax=Candidatus Amunia macphersoniae TaxID=3127014 RepID=A0A934KPE7_9BACT|nr:IS21 family transposase [Candidatus Dormibacteraeota bacterium]
MKSTREQLDIITAYQELGSYRAAAKLCGTTDKTVKQVVERQQQGELTYRTPPRPAHNTDAVRDLIHQRVAATGGRITAKRLLPRARTMGYTGSARNFRRAVAAVKAQWKQHRRVYRPWVPNAGEHLAIDWGEEGPLRIFCAVLAWSRYRFVRFASNQRRETTLRLLAECFEEMGGVPAVVLADRMGCLKAGTVANVVVPHPEYVRFAAHFGFRPDFCEAADPESKGVVENLVGYAKRDLVVPADGWSSPEAGNGDAAAWCAEVNGAVHSEIQAVPALRLVAEKELLRPLPSLRPALRAGEIRTVDRLSTVRFGSARYSVPVRLVRAHVDVSAEGHDVVIRFEGEEVARHAVVPPGAVAVTDDHYGGVARRPSRAVRPRSPAEHAFLAIGPVAERFLRDAAAAGTSRLEGSLTEILDLGAAFGREQLVAALERAVTYRRFRPGDVRAILEAGAGVSTPVAAGAALQLGLPVVPTRPLSAYALEELR